MMKKEEYFKKYNDKTHLIGRISSIICLIMFIAVPFVMGFFLKVMPDMSAFFKCILTAKREIKEEAISPIRFPPTAIAGVTVRFCDSKIR